MNILIEEKQELFNDLRIPWDKSIEEQFKIRMQQKPNADPVTVLDNIVHTYIERALSNPMENYIAFLKAKYKCRPITTRRLKSELGEEIFAEMIANGTLEPIEKTTSYRLKGDLFHASAL